MLQVLAWVCTCHCAPLHSQKHPIILSHAFLSLFPTSLPPPTPELRSLCDFLCVPKPPPPPMPLRDSVYELNCNPYSHCHSGLPLLLIQLLETPDSPFTSILGGTDFPRPEHSLIPKVYSLLVLELRIFPLRWQPSTLTVGTSFCRCSSWDLLEVPRHVLETNPNSTDNWCGDRVPLWAGSWGHIRKEARH
jgi:hypothetical protein